VTDEQTHKPGSFWRELPILVGVAVVVAVLVRAFVLQTFFIPSESMENTLRIDDRVLVNKLIYDFRDPRRGEVVVFEAPDNWRTNPTKEDFIKRVIGVGGDRVFCCDEQQRLVINGQPLDEPYLYADGNGSDRASEEPFDITVPPGRLWVMGDHRSHSGDSRDHFVNTRDIDTATVPVGSVVGRAFVIFWPVSNTSWLSVPGSFAAVPDP